MAKSRNFSRSKGVRAERTLVNLLKEQNIDARRVPGSGAFAYRVGQDNLKGDVLVDYDHKQYKIECKVRATDFNRIYELYNNIVNSHVKDLIEMPIIPGRNYSAIVTDNLVNLFNYVGGVGPEKAPKGFQQTCDKLENMRKHLKGECDILAIKGDRKPWLFVEYINND